MMPPLWMLTRNKPWLGPGDSYLLVTVADASGAPAPGAYRSIIDAGDPDAPRGTYGTTLQGSLPYAGCAMGGFMITWQRAPPPGGSSP